MPESLSLVAFHFHIVISRHVFHYTNRATSSRDETKIERRADLFFTFFLLSLLIILFLVSGVFFSRSSSLKYFFFNISGTSFSFSFFSSLLLSLLYLLLLLLLPLFPVFLISCSFDAIFFFSSTLFVSLFL